MGRQMDTFHVQFIRLTSRYRPVRAWIVTLMLSFLLAGCGSTSQPVRVTYDTLENRTTYRTSSIPIPVETQGVGYGSQFRKLQMRLQARCRGQNCKPKTALMVLSVSGGAELYLGDRTLVVNADDARLEWEDPRPDRDTRTERVVGVVARITVDMSQLKAIATAERVTGELGSVRLDIARRAQERVRAFLVQAGHLEAPTEA